MLQALVALVALVALWVALSSVTNPKFASVVPYPSLSTHDLSGLTYISGSFSAIVSVAVPPVGPNLTDSLENCPWAPGATELQLAGAPVISTLFLRKVAVPPDSDRQIQNDCKQQTFELIQDIEAATVVQLKTLMKEDFQNSFRKWTQWWDNPLHYWKKLAKPHSADENTEALPVHTYHKECWKLRALSPRSISTWIKASEMRRTELEVQGLDNVSCTLVALSSYPESNLYPSPLPMDLGIPMDVAQGGLGGIRCAWRTL
ncbi:hypothetical protein H920_13291 [Fukomys damarensis]|uniref:Uncharacterized protein n=1 Tax=Fukomys damarensis TaxID=885580 RepID=A0A091D524_FUKDA|nr:hypothetical protein H920_13291 [Fukomys damarensis]